MTFFKLFFGCTVLLMVTNNGNAKPKDVHIHLQGIGKETSDQMELNKHDQVTHVMNRGKEIIFGKNSAHADGGPFSQFLFKYPAFIALPWIVITMNLLQNISQVSISKEKFYFI